MNCLECYPKYLKAWSSVLTRSRVLMLRTACMKQILWHFDKKKSSFWLSACQCWDAEPLQLGSHPAFSVFLLIYSNAFREICNFISVYFGCPLPPVTTSSLWLRLFLYCWECVLQAQKVQIIVSDVKNKCWDEDGIQQSLNLRNT